jgi:hypothetical protein
MINGENFSQNFFSYNKGSLRKSIVKNAINLF